MTETIATASSGRGLRITLYVVSALLTALYLFAGSSKFFSEQAVEGFRNMGYSDGFRIFIGSAELSGAIGLWLPRLAFWAAVGLAMIMVGAVHTHLTVTEAGPPTTAAIALVLLLFVAWARKGKALFLS